MASKEKRGDYDYAAAKRAGFGPDASGHWPSRHPITGQIFKRPGHETFHKSVKEDREKGYRTVIRGDTAYSFERGDPRLGGGSVNARRDLDISQAVMRRMKKEQTGK